MFRQDLAAQHIEASRYAAQLDCSLEHFPREDFLLMRFEDLQSDPLTELRRICLSLEIDPDYAFPRVGRPSEAWPKSWLERVSGMFRRLGRAPVRSDRLAQGYGVDTSLWQTDARAPGGLRAFPSQPKRTTDRYLGRYDARAFHDEAKRKCFRIVAPHHGWLGAASQAQRSGSLGTLPVASHSRNARGRDQLCRDQ